MYDSSTYNYMRTQAHQNDYQSQAQRDAMVKEAKSGQSKRSFRTNIGLSLIKLGQRVAQSPRLQEA